MDLLLLIATCALALASQQSDETSLKGTVWRWNNWRDVTFHADGRFTAPEPNCQDGGCTWRAVKGWSGASNVDIDWKGAGMHTVQLSHGGKKMAGKRFDGDRCSAVFVKKLPVEQAKAVVKDLSCAEEGMPQEACGTSYDKEHDDYDPYGIMGVDADAPEGVIKKAFRKLSVKYHPDKDDSSGAAKMFTHVRDAYEVVGDEGKRILFDTGGMELVQEGEKEAAGGGQRGGLESLFGGGRRRQGTRGPDASVQLEATLEDMYNGGELDQNVARRVVCRGCKGKRATGKCAGCGRCPNEVKTVMRQLGPGFNVQQQEEVPSEHLCKQAETNLNVVVEKGMADGAEVRFPRLSEQTPGKVPGDIVVSLKQRAHPRFKRQGDDLHTDMHITLKEALVGYERTLEHLDQHSVELKTGGITKPFQVRKFKGEGMPLHEFPSDHGDLFVKFYVDMPKTLTKGQREFIENNF